MQLIPVGYGNSHHRDLIARLMPGGECWLVDTRLKPVTGFYSWSRAALKRIYGDSYAWLGHKLGNKNYDHPELGIEIVDIEGGLQDLMPLLQERTVLLLCGCGTLEPDPAKKRPHGCHNRVVCDAAVEWCSEIEIVLPETLIAQEQRLVTLQEGRAALERKLSGEKPALANYWSLPAATQQEIRYERGLKK